MRNFNNYILSQRLCLLFSNLGHRELITDKHGSKGSGTTRSNHKNNSMDGIWISSGISNTTCGHHRRVLPVLRYPRNMVIYHYPLFWVIFMVIFLNFIIQNYPNYFSKYYPKFTIWVIYPFIFNLGEF